MRIKLIEDLPMASSAELYQLSWVIEQLLADPQRIVQARAALHTGQQVHYLHWEDGELRAARVVAMKDRRVTVFDKASRGHFTIPMRFTDRDLQHRVGLIAAPRGADRAAFTNAPPRWTATVKPGVLASAYCVRSLTSQ